MRVAAFSASSVEPRRLGRIISRYLSLERARAFRRALTRRCGILAAAGLVIALCTDAVSVAAWSVVLGLLIGGPVAAWVVEFQVQLRLARELERAGVHEKVVKSP